MKTPQELIDMPGYGDAHAALVKQKQWDESRAFDGKTEYQVTVAVSGTHDPQKQTQIYTVTSKTKEDAINMAEELSDFDDIIDCEITAVKETP